MHSARRPKPLSQSKLRIRDRSFDPLADQPAVVIDHLPTASSVGIVCAAKTLMQFADGIEPLAKLIGVSLGEDMQ